MTGRPGDQTMEINIEEVLSSYLARTPCVSSFMFVLIGMEIKLLLHFQVAS